ncbi:MAG: S8 family serine peptidase [Saprospiraceae bacterium]|nr:S8 family serine peptidase [Saprospiraceae bacterium]
MSIIFLLLLSSFARAQWDSKIDRSLEPGQTAYDCCIYFGQNDLETSDELKGKSAKGKWVFDRLSVQARNDQRAVIAYLKEQDIEFRSYKVVNAVFAHLSWEDIETLSRYHEVESIVENGILKKQQEERNVMNLREDVTWGIQMIGADSVWRLGYRGQGVVVGGEDTGVKWDIPAIKEMYRGNEAAMIDHDYNWHDAIHEINPMHGDSVISPANNPCGLDVKYPCDDHGHGTHTVGTMVGEDGEMKIGVAPDSKWIACRCMERGYGTLETYVECFEFFLAPTDLNGENPMPELAPDVINNSWGCPRKEGCNPSNFAIMEAAVDNLKAAGIFVVVSAGNDGSSCSSLRNPAAIFANSFTVGATNQKDTITGFSSRGPVVVDSSFRTKPDVAAPGLAVVSQLPDSSYQAWNGTSMAGPHVAGLVALILSANPELKGEVDIIEDVIISTAVRKLHPADTCDVDPIVIPNNTYGYGRINAVAAVEKALGLITTSDKGLQRPHIRYNSPFDRYLRVWNLDAPGTYTLELLNTSGQRIRYQRDVEASEWYWSTGDLPPGGYFLRLTSDQGEWGYKLIKTR